MWPLARVERWSDRYAFTFSKARSGRTSPVQSRLVWEQPVPAPRRPHDRHRSFRAGLRAKVAADPNRERHVMTQTACQRRRFSFRCTGSTPAAIPLGKTTPISQSIGRSYPSRRHRDPHCALPGPLPHSIQVAWRQPNRREESARVQNAVAGHCIHAARGFVVVKTADGRLMTKPSQSGPHTRFTVQRRPEIRPA